MNNYDWNLNSDVIAHHGILRQRWGERNGPPYPLNPDRDYTKAEKKAAGMKTNKSDEKPSNYSGRVSGILGKYGDTKVKDLVGMSHITYRENGKVVREYESGNSSGFINGQRWNDCDWEDVFYNADNDTYSSATDLDVLFDDEGAGYSEWKDDATEANKAAHAKGQIGDYDLQHCNWGREQGLADGSNNCADCSYALEMNLRGKQYAAGRSRFGIQSDADDFYFKGAKHNYNLTADEADMLCHSYGKNTSGVMAINWKGGGGHKVHWTNDSDGNFEIQDGQIKRRYKSVDDLLSAEGADPTDVEVTRLDNCEPIYEHMKQDSILAPNRDILDKYNRAEDANFQVKLRNKLSGHLYDRY